MARGEKRRTGAAGETGVAANAVPTEILARQFDVPPRHGLKRLLALEDAEAPLLVDQGDGAPAWYERDAWRVFSPKRAELAIGRTIARFRLDDGEEAMLSHDPSSGRLYAPF